jgi:probable F420-dependent oxidoreductase
MLSFGSTLVNPPPPPTFSVELAVMSEKLGFKNAWFCDSHLLAQDPYPALTLMADRTKAIKIGTCVTNPVTRHWTVTASAFSTLNESSDGRMILGIGRGDSAVRAMGRRPATIDHMERAIVMIKALARGEEVRVGNAQLNFPWATRELPIYVAAYGPRALRLAGRIADGVIIQIADPFVVGWCLKFVREAAREVGRDFSEIKIQCAAPSVVSEEIDYARQQVRYFPATVSNHVMDLIEKYSPAALPVELTEFTKLRSKATYDYREHTRSDAKHAQFVPDDVVDRFTVIGSPGACIEKLKELESMGVTEFNIYLSSDTEPEKQLRLYGDQVLPSF